MSAISIVASAVTALAAMRSSFIFATHLHELVHIESVEKARNVCVRHMRVVFDESMDLLIYDRVLHEGSGDTLYGLEVCRSLDMGTTFLEAAATIREQLLESEKTGNAHKRSVVRKSVYNRRLVVDRCTICGKSEGVQTHHIREQAFADNDQIIDARFHKNRLSNIVALCATCHAQHHRGAMCIDGFITSSAGIKLKVSGRK
jgi:DNA mismatch repair protein MutS